MSLLQRFLGSNQVVGLDIGSSSIKLVELRKDDKGFHLQRAGVERLPWETIVDGAVMDSARVVDAIHRLCERTRVKNQSFATSVSGHGVIIKKIRIPAVPVEELSESLQWEAEQYIPFDLNEVRLDYVVLEEGEPGRDEMEILLVAVKREKVNDYVSVISQVGKTVCLVDVDTFALQNAYEVNYDLDPRKVVALINMGASVTSFNILARGTTVFWRDLRFGGNEFTGALQRVTSLPFEHAEALIRGRRISFHGPADVLPVVDQVSIELASEIRKAFQLFAATSSEGPVDQIILSGGCALTPNLPQVLSNQLGVPTELMDPLRLIQYRESDFDTQWLQSIAPALAVAVGLAVRTTGDETDTSFPNSPPVQERALRWEPRLSIEVSEKATDLGEPVQAPLPSSPERLAIEYFRCFISYSHVDQEFALRLHSALKERGVDCWLDAHNMLPGDDIHDGIHHGIQLRDKVLLCCSETSLEKSTWVDREIEKALEKEDRLRREQDPELRAIIPLDLDGHLFVCQKSKASYLRSRMAADFKNWRVEESFRLQIERLLAALHVDRRRSGT